MRANSSFHIRNRSCEIEIVQHYDSSGLGDEIATRIIIWEVSYNELKFVGYLTIWWRKSFDILTELCIFLLCLCIAFCQVKRPIGYLGCISKNNFVTKTCHLILSEKIISTNIRTIEVGLDGGT